MITRHRLRWRIQHWLESRLPGLLTCAQFEALLDGYLDSDLTARSRVAVDFHIRTCPACKRYLAAYGKVRALIPETLTQADADALATVPEDLVTAILAARDAEAGRDGG